MSLTMVHINVPIAPAHLKNKANLYWHLKTVHDKHEKAPQEKHVCSKCDKVFTNKANLQRHELSHSARVREFKCDGCVAQFYSKAKLKRHAEQHEVATEEIVCPFCKGRFPSKIVLGNHKQMWHGVPSLRKKPAANGSTHQCGLCSQSFKSAAIMKCHMLSHSGAKNFKCLICQKAYTRKNSLQCHIRSHKGD